MTIPKEAMLSTYDNEINPFEDFEGWWKIDMLLGHDTCGYLARETENSSVFSDELNEELIDEAMKRIVKREPYIYRIVVPSDYKKSKKKEKELQM